MNEKPYPKIHTSTLAVLLTGVFLALPVACDDDDRIDPIEGGATGGESSSGGNVGSGGASSGGKIGSGGAGGGASGGTSSGGKSTGGASSGGTSSGGANTEGGVPDGGDMDGGPDRDGGPDGGGGPCSEALDANSANLCLTFEPEVITFDSTKVDLNGRGTLIVDVFTTATPAAPTDRISRTFYPAPPTATPGSSEQVMVTGLQKMGFSGLPDAVYVRTIFVDNPAWLATGSGLTWGLFVGGIDLNSGVRPPPPLRKIDLVKGQRTAFTQRLTALKKFTTNVALNPEPPVVPADDGQGPISVGVFHEQAPLGALVHGGGELPCVNITAGPVPMAGFFYTLGAIPTTGAKIWFGAQVDDFNKKAITPPGSIVSLVNGPNDTKLIPPNQFIDALPGQYSATAPNVILTFVLGGWEGSAPYACPVP